MEASGWKVNSEGWVDMFNHTKKEGNLERRERETWVLGCEEEGKKKGFLRLQRKNGGKNQ